MFLIAPKPRELYFNFCTLVFLCDTEGGGAKVPASNPGN